MSQVVRFTEITANIAHSTTMDRHHKDVRKPVSYRYVNYLYFMEIQTQLSLFVILVMKARAVSVLIRAF